MSSDTETIKTQILAALRHPEADEGLFFRNFTLLHEEDERPAVEADEVQILDALGELINSGQVIADETGNEVIFMLPPENGSGAGLS